MLQFTFFLAFLCFFLNTFQKDVLELTEADFTDVLDSNEWVLVEFYAEWCGHCKAFAPEYAKIPDLVDIPVAKVNGPENEALMRNLVTGFPTVILFKNGVKYNTYKGERSATAVASWLDAVRVDPVSKSSVEDLEKLNEQLPFVLVAQEGGYDLSRVCSLLREEGIYDLVCYTVDDLSSYGDYSMNNVMFMKGTSKDLVPSATLADDGLFSQYIFRSITEKLIRIDEPDAFRNAAKGGLSSLFVFVDADYEGSPESVKSLDDGLLNDEQRELLKKIDCPVLYVPAKRYFHYVSQVLGPDITYPYITLNQWNNSEPDKVWFQNHYFDDSFVLFSEEGVQTVNKFLKDVESGAVTWRPKSEPIPEGETGPVYSVVADNFDEVVLDKEKVVVFEVYSPNCPHCVRFAPEYEKAAKKFESNPRVLFTKFNGVANDVPSVLDGIFRGFPTVVLFKDGGDNSPNVYSGDRSVDDVVSYVNSFLPADEAVEVEKKEETSSESDAESDAESDDEHDL